MLPDSWFVNESLGERSRGQNRASDATRDLIRTLIYTGELGPGDPLPPERELYVQLGVSRTALREALKYLEAKGYIVTRVGAGGGTRVADAAALQRCCDEWRRDQGDGLESLLELQRIIESAVAYFAAERRTAADLERLASLQIPPDPTRAELLRCHREFHLALASAARNKHLEQAMRTTGASVFMPLDEAIGESRVDSVRAAHERIFLAVRDKDPGRAASEMDAYLRSVFHPGSWEIRS